MKRRKYLSQHEVDRLVSAIPAGETGIRNRCLVQMCYSHGLRASELLSLRLCDLDMLARRLNIARLKNGFSTVHPLQEKEGVFLEARLSRRAGLTGQGIPWLFVSRQGRRLSRQYFHRVLKQYGELAGLPVAVHPHMLRHACGYALAEQGRDTRLIQDYLGHRNICHTVLYTASNPERFRTIQL